MVRKWLFAALCLGLGTVGAVAQGETSGAVVRAQITTGVIDREPVDVVTQLGTDVSTVNFFTELHKLEGQEVVHRWEYNGEVMAEVNFNVNGPRWRVWSSKELMPDWEGQWTVSVMSAGEVLHSESFNYGELEAPDEHEMTAEDDVVSEDEVAAENEIVPDDEATAEEDGSAEDEAAIEAVSAVTGSE